MSRCLFYAVAGMPVRPGCFSYCPLMQFAPAADVHVAWRTERGIALSMSGGLLRVHRHACYPYFAPECVEQGTVLWPVGLKITPKYRRACVKLAN